METNNLLLPARNELGSLLTTFAERLPYLVSGVLVAVLFVLLSFAASKIGRKTTSLFIENNLIVNVLGKVFGFFIAILGLYLGLKISGLSQLAATILGGTGLAGLIFGFAFRDIAENFLASILLSVHRPFKIGDVVVIDGERGIVERMTIRCTVLMNFDGDHIQIPNSTVFKSKIRNVSANRNQRSSFTVGVGFDAHLSKVQHIILDTIKAHPDILKEPKPNVLIEELGSATVTVKVMYWIDMSESDSHMTRSSIIRMTKNQLEQSGISMPDEAREIIFPQGVPVKNIESDHTIHSESNKKKSLPVEPTYSAGESDGASERESIKGQLVNSNSPESGQNIL